MVRGFKQLLAEEELVRVFAIGRLVHPVVLDLYGMIGGFHGFWADQEHAGLTYEQVVLASACARANDFDFFVRMAPTNYAQVTQNLEAGAGGVMAAMITSAEHAEQFVQWAKFAPRGQRGLNSSGRDGHYTGRTQAQMIEHCNQESFVAIQIETLGALDEVDRIAAIDGVDLVFVGPSDLSQSLGVAGQFDHDKLWEAYRAVSQACESHGVAWATIGVNPSFSQRALDLGCRMLNFGNDANALRRGIETTKQAFSDFFA